MRYPKEHNAASRRNIVERAGRHAKAHGFGESGVATLAASAGVTTGALYKQFGDKAGLFTALVEAELERTARLYENVDPASDADVMRALLGYLSLEHVEQAGAGCPLPSLTSEIARADEAVRAAFQRGLLEIHARLRRLTRTSDDAWTLLAQNVGAVMLARALPDEKRRKELLSAARFVGKALLRGDLGAAAAPNAERP